MAPLLPSAPKGNQNRVIQRGQNGPAAPERTASRLASEHGVSPRTIKRDAAFAALGVSS